MKNKFKGVWRKCGYGGETMETCGGEWRPHPSGLYPKFLVGSLGRIWNVSTNCMLKGNKSNGYLYVSHTEGQKLLPVHTLVAETYISERPTAHHTVNHIDRTAKTNNAFDNLEWATQSEQILHNYATGQKPSNMVRVAQYTEDGLELLNEFQSVNAAATHAGVTVAAILNAIARGHNLSAGFLWERLDDEVAYMDMPGEEWRPVVLPHRYTGILATIPDTYVSQFGRIRKGDRIRSCSIHAGTGYRSLSIRFPCDSTSIVFSVHRFVAYAFVANPDSKPFVDHINGNKTDNSASNLQWVTNRENICKALYIRTTTIHNSVTNRILLARACNPNPKRVVDCRGKAPTLYPFLTGLVFFVIRK